MKPLSRAAYISMTPLQTMSGRSARPCHAIVLVTRMPSAVHWWRHAWVVGGSHDDA